MEIVLHFGMVAAVMFTSLVVMVRGAGVKGYRGKESGDDY